MYFSEHKRIFQYRNIQLPEHELIFLSAQINVDSAQKLKSVNKETGYDGGQVTIVFPRFTGGHFASQRPSQPDVRALFNNSILESMFSTCCGAQVHQILNCSYSHWFACG